MEIDRPLGEYTRLQEQESRELLRLFDELGIATAERVYAPGDEIYREGEYGDGLYILTDGVLKLFRPYSGTKEATLRLLTNWDIFGHLAFEGETKQRAYAEAVTECRVTKAPKIFVERAVKRDPRVAFKIMTLFELRLVQYEELVKCLLPRETEVRVANLLPLLAQKFGKPAQDGGTAIDLRLTHQDLAAMVASTRESVTKVLNEFRSRGIITIQSGRITLREPETLEVLARA
ncbi:cAMP-binding proteins - catabolite gene activator and regulatory subunit of cAMP-dependent protein kinase [Rubrobacter radiotolerans]|uniref:Crp/Fnr family transcriptional regulator n=1 Tax=Rubrobacter radiotolerans TaxID=42256 RepID=A0A023X358_RUBRA|nr:Crp/Fnr family transcriptional regulator [Rubrobacter radiotolerans]AHY46504.1 cAMP-binding proteins - catabolite gene activator and regulatory subunit of cAMP-dependent protein kinase [Rubrobacter radiotolerans]MDX5893911.1 Crp/Fnr family transcriptional regulator [Rubrobacter radiotolerans]SMC04753.1 transcriptional regulator, Crp/Fnr family [Rubrobacter radiotolerans DSM 5868]